MKYPSLLICSGLLLGLSACAPLEPYSSRSRILVEVDDVSTGGQQTLPAVALDHGQPVVLHATKSGRVVFRQGDRTKPLDETARVKNGASYFQLKQPIAGNWQALWWSHQDGKNGYFTMSKDGGASFSPVSMVNSDHQILQPITWTTADSGAVGIAYHDERLPTYQVFFNRSTDSGRTWAKQDQRLDTPPPAGRSSFVSEPQMVQTKSAWVLVWVDTVAAADGAFRVIARRSQDEGQTWSEPDTIYAGARHISALTVRATQSDVLVVADELESGIFALHSSDDGRTWAKSGVLDGTAHASNSGIATALAQDRLHITWMQDRQNQKTQILAATLNIASSQWLAPAKRLDTKSMDNTRSQTPAIAASLAGSVVAAWVDFRDIRPNIYLAYSWDQGLSWTTPQPLKSPGAQALGWPQLVADGETLAIAYEAYPTDRVMEGRFVVETLPTNDADRAAAASRLASKTTESQRKARLEQRIKDLWAARIAGDYAKAYDYFDFAYKAVTPKKHYVENAGVITYLAASLDTTAIEANEAKVNMKLRYEVKPTFIPGAPKPIEVLPVDVDLPNTWVWVADDWYLVFQPSFDPPVLKY